MNCTGIFLSPNNENLPKENKIKLYLSTLAGSAARCQIIIIILLCLFGYNININIYIYIYIYIAIWHDTKY
jgi:hypothetical protein